ncbi:MAG: hypothetical protein WDZ40_03495 [Candidatus Spechtbacterales bacterium]
MKEGFGENLENKNPQKNPQEVFKKYGKFEDFNIETEQEHDWDEVPLWQVDTSLLNILEFYFEGLEDKLSSEKVVQDAFKEGFLKFISKDNFDTAINNIESIKNALKIPDEIFKSEEFLNDFKKVIELHAGDISLFFLFSVAKKFNIEKSFFDSPDVHKILTKQIWQEFNRTTSHVSAFFEFFNFTEEDIVESFKGELIEELKKGENSHAVFNILHRNKDSEFMPENIQEIISKDGEVLEVAESTIISNLKEGRHYVAFDIAGDLKLGEEFLQKDGILKAAEEGLRAVLQDKYYSLGLYLKKFPIPKEKIKSKTEKNIVDFFRLGAVGNINEILETLERAFEGENVEDAFKEGFDFERIDELILKESQENAHFTPIYFVNVLGSGIFARYFPKIFEYAKGTILEELSKDEDLADYFIERMHSFQKEPWLKNKHIKDALKHPSVAQKFYWDQKTWGAFKKTENQIKADKKIVSYAKSIMEKAGLPTNLQDRGEKGFSENDPYKNHPWLFTSEQAHSSRIVEGLMAGENVDSEELEKLGIKTELTAGNLFEKLNNHIEEKCAEFVNDSQANLVLDDLDKLSLARPDEFALKPLSDNVRSLLSRLFVQKYGRARDFEALDSQAVIKELDPVLNEAFRRYLQVLEKDVKYYDKLYDEFDTWREAGRYPMEVYLGRDGIYAYIGRRAQDIARRKKLGKEGREKIKEEQGEVLEIRPRYLVYPRYFRDTMAYDSKKKFLEQEKISPEHDPIFYDTGFTGSIPEQIMRVMDFPEEEIENRIRLLSASKTGRRVRGIDENARGEIINYIEGNAKIEQSAVGLMQDPETGKIRHIAEPTPPEEQFYFNMIKQAIERHYWSKEYANYEASGNINIDSETHRLRLRQDYVSIVPQELLQAPGEFIKENGELLKGGPNDLDGESRVLKLLDGTEIIAKRAVSEKAREERKEYAVLISAQNSNLPTAEPVGYLEAKNDEDSDYLLMTKVKGISGGKIREKAESSQRLSKEDVERIMQKIVEENKNLADKYRQILKLDKRWRVDDIIVEFDEESGELLSITPIDWEEAGNYDPKFPKEIDTMA